MALCPPQINLDDGGSYRPSRGQRWLWGNYLEFAQEASNLTKGYDRRILAIVGDWLEMDVRRRSLQLITRNPATVLRMGITTLEPLLDIVDSTYIFRGTAAHSGKSAALEEALAQDITNVIPDPDRKTSSWWHMRRVASGVRLDIAHHASMGGLPWTEKNAAIRAAAIIWHRYQEMNQPVPNIVLRAHNHRYADSGENYDPLHVFFMPAWSLATEYLYRTGKENDLAQIGGFVILCQDGHYEMHRKIFKPETRRIWATTM